MSDHFRIPHQDEAGDHDPGLRDDRDGADDAVEIGGNLDTAHVQPDQEEDAGDGLQQPDPGHVDGAQVQGEVDHVVARSQVWNEEVEVAEGYDREERDVDGVVEHQRRAGHQSPEVSQSPQCEVLPPTGQRVGRGQLGVAEADQRENQAGRQECEWSKAQGSQGDDSKGSVDAGPDGGVAPHIGAPYRDVTAKLAAGNPLPRRLHPEDSSGAGTLSWWTG